MAAGLLDPLCSSESRRPFVSSIINGKTFSKNGKISSAYQYEHAAIQKYNIGRTLDKSIVITSPAELTVASVMTCLISLLIFRPPAKCTHKPLRIHC